MTHTTFIHSSDLQIGMTRKFLSPEAQARFDESRERSIDALGNLARDRGAEFIVIAGDVFEHNSLEERTLGRALEALRRLPVPVFLLPGNHDPLVADSIFSRTEDIENVTVLSSSEPIEAVDGVDIVGAPLLTKYPSDDLCAQAVRALEPSGRVRILVGHGQVEGFGTDDDEALIHLDPLEDALSRGVIDYVALGDSHSTASLGSSGKVWFSGAPETTDYAERSGTSGPAGSSGFSGAVAGGESDSGNALVVTVTKDGGASEVSVDKVRTGIWTFDALGWEVTDADDVAEVIDQLRAYPDKDRTVIKYALTGTLGLEATRTLARELAALEPVFAALYERDRLMDLHLEPGEEELDNLPLTGYASQAMHQLVGEAAQGDPTARDAVNLLFRFSQEAK